MSHHNCVLLSIPGLRDRDVASMPNLAAVGEQGAKVALRPSFPAVTCPVQANLTTGVGPEKHGVIANGFYWRDRDEVEMWTAWNAAIEAPQIWKTLKQRDPSLTSAVWFPLLSKGAEADFICTPAPIHNPDGSESLWCYTRPEEMYGTLRDEFGHFPLMNFWGPLSSIKSSNWIIDTAVWAAQRHHPRFTYVYIPHLDYAAQKFGPDSPEALRALGELDEALGRLFDGYRAAGYDNLLWLIASEYVITPANQVVYPNRVLREAGWLSVEESEGELLKTGQSRAWALVDHQFAHVFVRDPADVQAVQELLSRQPGVERAVSGSERASLNLDHPRSGEIVLVAEPDAWFAYYWWVDDAKAPPFARTVDIHRKPGYDPVEMFLNMSDRSTPLDATLVKGTHGYPADDDSRLGVLIASDADAAVAGPIRDVEVAGIILNSLGVG